MHTDQLLSGSLTYTTAEEIGEDTSTAVPQSESRLTPITTQICVTAQLTRLTVQYGC